MTKEIYWINDTGCQTLMGFCNIEYPAKRGNVISYGKKKLCNLNAENLHYLLKNRIAEFPIKCEIEDDQTLMCVDERIPTEFLIDTRKDDAEWRKHAVHQFTVSGDDYILNGYKITQIWDDAIVWCPYIPKIKNIGND